MMKKKYKNEVIVTKQKKNTPRRFSSIDPVNN